MEKADKEEIQPKRCEEERTYNPDLTNSALHVLQDPNPPICKRCIEEEPGEGVVPKPAVYGYRICAKTGYIDIYDELVYCEEHRGEIGMLHAQTGALSTAEMQVHERIIEQERADLIRQLDNESKPIDMVWLKRTHLPFTSDETSEMASYNYLGHSCGCEESLMVLAQQYVVKEAEARHYKKLAVDKKKRGMQQEPGETRRKNKK